MAGMEAIAGTARAGAFRSGYFARDRVLVQIAGASRTGIIKDGLAISERIGREPATADLTMKGGSGFVPNLGQPVTIAHGTLDQVLFRGRIQRVSRTVTRHVERRPTYQIEAAGPLADLARAYPMPGYAAVSVSATSAVVGLLSVTTPSPASMGFTTPYVASGLPVLASFAAGPDESVAAALDRLAETIGATWYADQRYRLHFYTGSDPMPRPSVSTITAASFGHLTITRESEYAPVFSRVVGVGATVRTTADCWSNENGIPVDSFEALFDARSQIGLFGRDYVASNNYVMFAEEPRVLPAGIARSLAGTVVMSGANPKSLISRSLWVAEVMHADPGSSPWMAGRYWWNVDGNLIRPTSVSVFSSGGGQEYLRVFVPSSGPGAPPPTVVGAVPNGTPIYPYEFEVQFNIYDGPETNQYHVYGSIAGPRRIIPKGSPVRLYYEASSSTYANAITSMTGNSIYATATDTLDGDFGPAALISAVRGRLAEGAPANWQTFTLETRDIDITVGQMVPMAITNPAEPSGPSYTGTFTVTDLTIAGFSDLAPSKGPRRVATLGVTRKPSLFSILS